ncbi:hypothetical protein PVAND_016172 [Polypedilum vanderplanki]|uniref:Uncharacterized protein n=1 Tax=Polypedilum vanderplanki TaxID=319348 RepID=A0A9J6BF28_POLVA|nr:hypothetical protein PVAND_016172 [Polypedilum vanderplanki]
MALGKILRTDSFLCCFRLESGGIFIGGLGLAWCLFQLISQIVLLLSLMVVEDFCPQRHYFWNDNQPIRHLGNYSKEMQHDVKNVTSMIQRGLQNATQTAQEKLYEVTNEEFSCTQVSKIPLGLILLIAIILNVIGLIAHYRLVKGVEESDHSKLPLTLGYYKFFIGLKFIFLIGLIIWACFNYKLFMPAILMLICLIIDVYIYRVIDTLRYKYENTLPLSAQENRRIITTVKYDDDAKEKLTTK